MTNPNSPHAASHTTTESPACGEEAGAMDSIDKISNTIQQLTRKAQAAVGQGGSDSRFFQNTSKKGEVHELREVRLQC